MEKKEVLNALKELRTKSSERKFVQSVDFHMNLKYLDLKKPEHKIDFFMQLPKGRGKKLKIGAFVDHQLYTQAKKIFDTVVVKEEFSKWNNKTKEQRKLAASHDFFVAQIDIMAPLAATFGKVLGARGKMPNPKAGCVVPGSANLEPLAARLQNTIRLQTKNELSIKTSIGNTKLSDDDLSDNILAVYNTILSKLPQEKNNIKSVSLKLTMSPVYKFGSGLKSDNKENNGKKKS